MERRAGKAVIIILISLLLSSHAGHSDASDGPVSEAPLWCAVSLVRNAGPSNAISGQEILITLRVEVVTRIPSLTKGLSDRPNLPAEEGMLFVVDPKETPVFWMRGMKFPLDIIFFDREKKITDMFQDLQPCENCTTFSAREPSPYTLEINAGLSRIYGLRRGDILVIQTCE